VKHFAERAGVFVSDRPSDLMDRLVSEFEHLSCLADAQALEVLDWLETRRLVRRRKVRSSRPVSCVFSLTEGILDAWSCNQIMRFLTRRGQRQGIWLRPLRVLQKTQIGAAAGVQAMENWRSVSSPFQSNRVPREESRDARGGVVCLLLGATVHRWQISVRSVRQNCLTETRTGNARSRT
jgi:hypothetical protein